MKITVTITKEEIEKAIRTSLYHSFTVKNNAPITFNYDPTTNFLTSASLECEEKKTSTYYGGDGRD